MFFDRCSMQIKRIINNSLGKALLMNVMAFFLVLLFFEPYLIVDDQYYVQMLNGALGDDYLFYNTFINWIYTYLLTLLIRILPMIPWYTIMFNLLVFIAMTLISKMIIDLYPGALGIFVSMLLCYYYAYEGYVSIQFTKVAGICGVVGVVAFVFSNRICEKILGFVLMIFGMLIRPGFITMDIAIGIACLIFVDFFAKTSKGVFIRRVIIYIVIFILSYQCINNSDRLFANFDGYDEWKEYASMNYLRSGIQDYPIKMDEKSLDRYEKLDVSENDIYIWSSWNYDWDIITDEMVSTMSTAFGKKSSIIIRAFEFTNIRNFLKTFPLAFLTIDVFYLYISIAILFVLYSSDRKKTYLSIGVCFALLIIFNYYLFLNGRYLIHRVDVGIILGSILLLICTNEKNISTNANILHNKRAIGIILLLCISVPYFYYWEDVNSQSECVDANHAFFEETSTDKEHFFVFGLDKNGGWGIFNSLHPYDVPKIGAMKNVYRGTRYPVNEDALEEYGIDNPYLDIIDNEQTYLVLHSTNRDAEKWKIYLSEHSGKQVNVEKVKSYYGIDIYRAYTDKNSFISNAVNGKVETTGGGECRGYLENGIVKIQGNVFLEGENGFKQNIYVKWKDSETNAEEYYFTYATEKSSIEKDAEGKYANFICSFDAPELFDDWDEISVIIADNDTVYELKLNDVK